MNQTGVTHDSSSASGSTIAYLVASVRLMVARARVRWALVVALGAIVAALEALGAGLIFGLVGSVLGGRDLADSIPSWAMDALPGVEGLSERELAAGIGLFFVVRAGASWAQAFLGASLVFNRAADLSADLFNLYAAQPYQFHIARSSADLIRNIRDSVDSLAHNVFTPLVRAASEGLVGVGLIAALILIAPRITLLLVVLLSAIVAIMFAVVRRALTPLGEQSHNAGARSLKASQELLRGIRDVIMMGRSGAFSIPFKRAQADWARANLWRSALLAAPRIVTETALAIGVLVVVAASGGDAVDGVSAIALVGVFGYAGIRLVPVAVNITSALSALSFGAASIDAVTSDLSLAPIEPLPNDDSGAVNEPFSANHIEFDSVSYEYPGSRAPALVDISFTVRPEVSVFGIMGASGGGKSTVVDLLVGLLEPTKGAVRVGGRDVRGMAGWQRRLGLVSQASFIRSDSVRRNIAYEEHDEDIDDVRVWEAAKIAVVPGVEHGPICLDRVVGEDGIELSGGERQRIAIARAIYRSPEVLVLDEATSALDPDTERRVMENLRVAMDGKKIIVVAHRPAVWALCDEVIQIDGGSAVGVLSA